MFHGSGVVRAAFFAVSLIFVVASGTIGLACVELKDPVPLDGPGSDAGTDAVDRSDGTTPPGDPIDAGSAPELALKRKRLTDAPPTPGEWLVSDAHVYVASTTGATPSLRRLRPADGSTVPYTFPLGVPFRQIGASDAYVVVEEETEARVYDATEAFATKYAELNDTSGVTGLETRVAWLRGNTLYTFDPAVDGAPQLAFTLAPASVEIVGRRGDDVFVRDVAAPELWLVDTAAKTAATWSVPAAPTGASAIEGEPANVVVQYGSAQAPKLAVVPLAGPWRDLGAEITAAASSLSSELRQPAGGFVMAGTWMVYAAGGGLLAFDVASRRLTAVQLPLSAGVTFRAPKALAAEGLLLFELRGGDEALEGKPGIYAVKLTDVLPR